METATDRHSKSTTPRENQPLRIISWMNASVLYAGAGNVRSVVEQAVSAGADLTEAALAGVPLAGARLARARLARAWLARAWLADADLTDADLTDSDLTEVDLTGARLAGARLTGARLTGANFTGADLTGARLDTGEYWEEYVTEVVPALLIAGGHTLEEAAAAWACHNWENCPMAVAFDVHKVFDAPPRFREQIRQFVQFFDAGLIPCPGYRHSILPEYDPTNKEQV